MDYRFRNLLLAATFLFAITVLSDNALSQIKAALDKKTTTHRLAILKDVVDGPYVLWRDKQSASLLSLANGKLEHRIIENITEAKLVSELPGPESSITLDPQEPVTPKAEWDSPSRVMAISDLEGNYDNAITFLKANKVLDESGHWSWGDGHLVLNGDLVDRGSQVTELMWLIKRLERESAAAGGHVHYILGNHEVMVMGGDTRYVHPKYHAICGEIRIPYQSLYGPTTEIGRWWRSKNAVERVGDLLFVHGGYSPKLDAANLNFDELNHRIRSDLPPKIAEGDEAGTNPVGHQHGPFWYRGYFDLHAASWGGKATKEQVAKILKRHNAKYVVVGHTVVPKVGPIDSNQQVIGIDVKWKDADAGEGLLAEGGKFYRVTMSGAKEQILKGK